MITSLPIQAQLLLTSSRVIFDFLCSSITFWFIVCLDPSCNLQIIKSRTAAFPDIFHFTFIGTYLFPSLMQDFPLPLPGFFFFNRALSHWFLTLSQLDQTHFWILTGPPSMQLWQPDPFIVFTNVTSNPFVNCINDHVCQKQPWETLTRLPSLPPGLSTYGCFLFPPAHRQQSIKAACSLPHLWGFLPVPAEVFNDIVRGSFTLFFSEEQFPNVQYSSAHGN